MSNNTGNDNSIDEVSVRLVADASDYATEINDAIEESVDKLEEFSDEWEKLGDDAKNAGLKFRQTLEEFAGDSEKAFESVQRNGKAFGFTLNELSVFAGAAGQEIDNRLTASMEQFDAAAAKAGKTISTEMRAEVEMLIRSALGLSRTVEQLDFATEAFTQGAIDGLADVGEEASDLDNILAEIGKGVTAFLQRFGIVALVLKGIQATVQFISESTELVIDQTSAYRNLELQVRQYQRVQGEAAGTTEEWSGFVKELTADVGGPLSANLRATASVVSQLSSEYSLNAEQIKNLIRVGVSLDKINTDLTNSSQVLADFIQSGSAEAFRNLGGTINDALFEQTAYALGIEKTIEEMSEAEKQTVRYQIVMDQLNSVVEDAAAGNETLAQRMQAVNDEMEVAQTKLGTVFAPVILFMKEVGIAALNGFVSAFQLFATAVIFNVGFVIAGLSGMAMAFVTLMNQIKSGSVDFEVVMQVYADTWESSFESIVISGMEKITDSYVELGDVSEEEMGSLATDAESAGMRIQEAFEKVSAELDRIIQKWQEGIAKAQIKLARKVEDIWRNAARKRADMAADLARDLSDIERDANKKRADAIEESQKDEVELKKKHARELKDLEDKFMFDLQDALRERDARRVRDILARMNKEKKNLTDDFKEKQKLDKANLKEELKAIDENEREKKRKRLEANRRALEDLRITINRRLADAQRGFERELIDLRTAMQRRLQILAEGLQAELGLTFDQLTALHKMLNEAYGPSGWVEEFYLRYAALLAAMGGAPAPNPPGTGGGGVKGQSRSFRTGVQGLIATSPTSLVVGEVPEMIDVSPLNTATGAPLTGFGNRGSGQEALGVLKVMLDAGLRGEIMNETFDEITGIMLEIQEG